MNIPVVLRYQGRLAWMVVADRKHTTIRKRGTAWRGDILKHEDTSGKLLRYSYCDSVDEVYMTATGFKLNGVSLTARRIEEIALADGFETVHEFRQFFRDTYGFPFSGELITWP